jgi:hypothetical protein
MTTQMTSQEQNYDDEPSYWSCGGLTGIMPSCSFWDEDANDADYDYECATDFHQHQRQSLHSPQQEDVASRRCLSAIEEERMSQSQGSSMSLGDAPEAKTLATTLIMSKSKPLINETKSISAPKECAGNVQAALQEMS